MNFGYPYAPNTAMDGFNTSGMNYMQQPSTCGCGNANMMPMASPQCNQVVQKNFVEDIPYYVDYHTHAVSNLCYIKDNLRYMFM